MIQMQRLLCWILILAAILNWPIASAAVTHSPLNTFSTPHSHIPITPLRTQTTPTNQAHTPASLQQPDNPQNTHHGDCLDDYLTMDDQGKAFQEVDPGKGNTPKAVLKEQVMQIYFQNINGIRLENKGADMLDISYKWRIYELTYSPLPKPNWPPTDRTLTTSSNGTNARSGTMHA
jgi:hypothetical protein